MLMAERTPGSDGLRRHRLHGRRDILAATLTVDHHAFRAFWSLEHEQQYRRIKGENNPQARKSGSVGPWSIREHRGDAAGILSALLGHMHPHCSGMPIHNSRLDS
jgi:hypothetical protein